MTPESRNIGARGEVGKHIPAPTKTQGTTELLLSYNNEHGVSYSVRPETNNEDPKPAETIIEGYWIGNRGIEQRKQNYSMQFSEVESRL
jgi:hypothetical protein